MFMNRSDLYSSQLLSSHPQRRWLVRGKGYWSRRIPSRLHLLEKTIYPYLRYLRQVELYKQLKRSHPSRNIISSRPLVS